MAKSVAMNVALMVLAVMLIAGPHAEAITCGQVASGLASCISYLQGSGPLPPQCCSGVKSLNAAASTPADRKTACGCLKQIAGSIPRINYSFASGLPGKCGVQIGYPISLSTDCSKVN
ncbi:non-specific lipid-transfer protein [Escherichia coli]|uniref:non-specific lipid-transfer protein n=1 Tax=Escherichia coli TaxID=562 RepID=UPI003855BE7B